MDGLVWIGIVVGVSSLAFPSSSSDFLVSKLLLMLRSDFESSSSSVDFAFGLLKLV